MQGLTPPQQNLEHFGALQGGDQVDDRRQVSQLGFRAFGCGRLVLGPVNGFESRVGRKDGGHVTGNTGYGRGNHGDPGAFGRPLEGESGRDGVQTVNDKMTGAEQRVRILRIEVGGCGCDLQTGVDRLDAVDRRLRFRPAQAVDGAQQLTVKVVFFEHISVHQVEPTNTHARQRLRDQAAQPPQPHNADDRFQQADLVNCR